MAKASTKYWIVSLFSGGIGSPMKQGQREFSSEALALKFIDELGPMPEGFFAIMKPEERTFSRRKLKKIDQVMDDLFHSPGE